MQSCDCAAWWGKSDLGAGRFHGAQVDLVHSSLLSHCDSQLLAVGSQQHGPGGRVQGKDVVQSAALHHRQQQAQQLGKCRLALFQLCLLPCPAQQQAKIWVSLSEKSAFALCSPFWL